MDKIIDLDGIENIHALLDALLPEPSTGEDGDTDLTRHPPQASPAMFPGILDRIISDCTAHSEAVPVAVAANALVRFSALIGAGAYLNIGDERRRLNEFFLMIGQTGLGKGGSGHGVRRIFCRAEDMMQIQHARRYEHGDTPIKQFPALSVHTGGLSSGEGIAATLHDGDENIPAVIDKRLLIFEPEFANVMTMFQRSGNTLSTVLRNAFDGIDIKPMTKRDKIGVTDPYICLFANITERELRGMDQHELMVNNGMLNRFLILWQQPVAEVAFPEPMPQAVVDRLAADISDSVMFSRNQSYETHYRKVRENSAPILFDEDATTIWCDKYGSLVNRADGEMVKSVTRRHRLHALLLSALFALLDKRRTIEKTDIETALLWIDYSRDSVIYAYNAWREQRQAIATGELAKKILYAVLILNRKQEYTTRTDIHNFYQRKLKAEDISSALECLMSWIPPLIRQEAAIMSSGRTVPVYKATEYCYQ